MACGELDDPWTGRTPFLVAHRFGNEIACGRRADGRVSAIVEADLRLHGDEVEVRHARRLGRLPVLFDRWSLRRSRGGTPLLRDLLRSPAAESGLLLDLKGSNERLAELVAAAIPGYDRTIAICARSWPLLRRFESLPVRRVASIGTLRQLEMFVDGAGVRTVDAVSVHEKLLTSRTVTGLRGVTDTILSWPVNAPARAAELMHLGVRGLITDDPPAVAALVGDR